MGENGRVESAARPLRVAMLFDGDPANAGLFSGMPFQMSAALRRAGVELVPVGTNVAWPWRRVNGTRAKVRRLVNRIGSELLRRGPKSLAKRRSEQTRRRILDAAARGKEELSACLDAMAAGDDRPDVLFGCNVSRVLYRVETSLPVVHFADALYRLAFHTYPAYMRRSRGFQEARETMERALFTRVAAAVFASDSASRSAVDDYGADPARVHTVPMGANVLPEDPAVIRAPAGPPTRETLRLCIIAADPERKRVDMCVRIAELLARRGYGVRLSYIGPPTRRAARSQVVDCLGALSLGDADHRRRHREILSGSHIQLLPSLGEAFGIAPCESAHYARPSIVSDVGGLPTVVLHNETGLVLPQAATESDYADAVESLVADPEKYRRLSTGALERARSTLNWDAWARQMVEIMSEVARAAPRAGADAERGGGVPERGGVEARTSAD